MGVYVGCRRRCWWPLDNPSACIRDKGRGRFLFETPYKVGQIKFGALREESIRDVTIYQDIGLPNVTTTDECRPIIVGVPSSG